MTARKTLLFMKNKIVIPILIAGALAAFFSFKYIGGDGNDARENRKQHILKSVMTAIKETHFSPRPIDDTFSARVYDKMLDQFDFDKKFFTASEIAQLQPYELKIDDEIRDNSTEFFDKFNDALNKGINRGEDYYKAILQQPFSFSTDENIQLNGDKTSWASDETALKDRWRKFLKYRTLVRLEELKKDSSTKSMSEAKLEDSARANVAKDQDSYFRRLRNLDSNERYSIYVNAITSNIDPHTDYFPPRDKQRFDEAMSGSFIGIGAQLKDDYGKIKITAIIAGSPSWKQGELKAGDEIMKVAQGPAVPEDIQGWDIDEVVQKIRGPKGTEVRLTVKKLDGGVKVIGITRGEVVMEETFAKSAIIKGRNGNIGYIYLPEFYADFQHANGRRCAIDVANEVEKLKASNVSGIILDLRNNGGGSLSDVVDMAGLFIEQGPVVQVKSSDAPPMTLKDNDKGTLYDGPMAIMVNQGSASASEIMAAAMQDYKRAVIIGTTTYGKGTVQKVIPLERSGFNPFESNNGNEAGDIGSLKITIQKFYRINGGSTQLHGVTPDISLPDPYQFVDIGERRDKAALPYDEIPQAAYQKWSHPANVEMLAAASRKRVSANASFSYIEANAKKVKQKEEDNHYSLEESKYRAELDEANATGKKLEDFQKKATLLSVVNLNQDASRINLDTSTKAKNDEWLKNLSKDLYLGEAVNIMNDMMGSQMKVNMGTGMK